MKRYDYKHAADEARDLPFQFISILALLWIKPAHPIVKGLVISGPAKESNAKLSLLECASKCEGKFDSGANIFSEN
jgi:hypothetical protein